MTWSERGHTCAVNETQWDRLYRLVEQRRSTLGLTLNRIQSEGGPSPRWVQNLRAMTGAPTPRMRSSMLDLDRALQWPDGTSWSLVSDDRSGWSGDVLLDEEQSLMDQRDVEPVAAKRSPRSPEATALDAAFAAQLRAERAAAGLNQAELGKAAGLSKQTILRFENESRSMDTAQLADICRALGITIVDFVLGAEQRLARERDAGQRRSERRA